jgi:hypothetical protein
MAKQMYRCAKGHTGMQADRCASCGSTKLTALTEKRILDGRSAPPRG